MQTVRQPANAKSRADQIGDMISVACEELIQLTKEWYELNDPEPIKDMRRMLDADEVMFMVSIHQEKSGLAHIALHLARTRDPLPKSIFEVRVPMLQGTLGYPVPQPTVAQREAPAVVVEPARDVGRSDRPVRDHGQTREKLFKSQGG